MSASFIRCRGREAGLRLRRLTSRDVPLLRKSLRQDPHVLSGFSLVTLLLWRPFFDIRWARVRGALCLFYDGAAGRFMPVPPLGESDAATLEMCRQAMAAVNADSPVSRIENLAEQDLDLFRKLGWRIYEKGPEYVVGRSDAAFLRGERLKHRRNLYNRFARTVSASARGYRPQDRRGVLALYRRWALERRSACDDSAYRRMLEESLRALEYMLGHLFGSGIVANVVEADGAIAAFTSGDYISPDVFCVHFEIADRRYPGAAQFIATQLARTLTCRLINTMDDAGLPNLRKSKLLMKPVMMPMSYCAAPV